MSTEIISAIEMALREVTELDVNTAQLVREGEHYECPFCDDGYLPAKDFTNIDDVALGIQFFGIGKEFGNAEKYLDSVLPWKMRKVLGRIASLEALVLELAKGVIAVRDLVAESGGVYGLHRNGDPSPWEELTEGGRFEEWMIDYSAAEAALSNPLVSELTGEKEGGE